MSNDLDSLLAEFAVVGDGMADIWLWHRAACDWGQTVAAGGLLDVVKAAQDHWSNCTRPRYPRERATYAEVGEP